MKRPRLPWLLLAFCLAPAIAAADKPDAIKLPNIDTFTLNNGLQVAVLRTDAAPVVAVQVWYHAGSKDEPRDRRTCSST
jgi:zinc protease